MTDHPPDSNPKTRVAMSKVPLHLVPASATHYLAMAFADGARKYGPMNWREEPVSASVYIAAAMRHLDLFREGQDCAVDSGVHNLAGVMACCAIILDAARAGTLNDDRLHGPLGDLQAEYKPSIAKVFEVHPTVLQNLDDGPLHPIRG